MKIKLLGNRILVKAAEAQEKSKGGIIIPDTAKEEPQEGKVKAVGPGKVSRKGKQIQMHVKAGDKILYSKYSGTEIEIKNEKYLIINEDNVLGIIE